MTTPVITCAALLTPAGESIGPLTWVEVTGATGVRYARQISPLRSLWPDAPERVVRATRVDRASAHGVFVAHRVLERVATLERNALAVIVGTALGCAEVNESYHRGLVQGGAINASPMLFARTIPSTTAGEIALAFGARGHSVTVMAGRCSGIAALADARRAIALGRCASALVVAGDVFGPDRLQVLALQGSTCPAEAMVALLLEHPAAAIDAGREPLAVLEVASFVTVAGETREGDIDWLGASGVVELVEWLRGTSRSFDVEVRCPWGYRGELKIVRAEPTPPRSTGDLRRSGEDVDKTRRRDRDPVECSGLSPGSCGQPSPA